MVPLAGPGALPSGGGTWAARTGSAQIRPQWPELGADLCGRTPASSCARSGEVAGSARPGEGVSCDGRRTWIPGSVRRLARARCPVSARGRQMLRLALAGLLLVVVGFSSASSGSRTSATATVAATATPTTRPTFPLPAPVPTDCAPSPPPREISPAMGPARGAGPLWAVVPQVIHIGPQEVPTAHGWPWKMVWEAGRSIPSRFQYIKPIPRHGGELHGDVPLWFNLEPSAPDTLTPVLDRAHPTHPASAVGPDEVWTAR